MEDFHLREIVEQPSWDVSAKRLPLPRQALDERLRGLTFEVARIPEDFPYVGDGDLQIARYTGNPPLKVLFTAEDERINLYWVEPDDDQAEDS